MTTEKNYNWQVVEYYHLRMWTVRGNSTRRIARDKYYAEMRGVIGCSNA